MLLEADRGDVLADPGRARRRRAARVRRRVLLRPRDAAARCACAATTSGATCSTEVALSGWRDGPPHQVDISPARARATRRRFALRQGRDATSAVPERAFVPRTPEGYRSWRSRTSDAAREPILKTVDLRMVYHVGKVEVQALRGVDIQVQTGRVRRPSSGPPAAASPRCCTCWAAWPGPPRGTSSWTASRSRRPATPSARAIRREKIGFVFQRFNLLPDPDRARATSRSPARSRATARLPREQLVRDAGDGGAAPQDAT